jgi:very-short-patch-repair endonuclease
MRGVSARTLVAMPRRPRIPKALSQGPFTLAEARRNGLDRWHLRGAGWRRIGPGTYLPAGLEETPDTKIAAASRRLPRGAAFSGLTAAWLHGLDVEGCDPIEITVAAPTTVSSRVGMLVRRRALRKEDVVTVRGLRATSVLRTIRDLCARLPLVEAVVLCDMALHRRLMKMSALSGTAAMKKVSQYVEPAAESPMESRLRMLIVLAGLPRPEAQVEIRDRFLRFLARPDLYYKEPRLALEYDGGIHRETLAEDNRRQNRLVDSGVRLLRFTAGDIYNSPDHVVSMVRKALAA